MKLRNFLAMMAVGCLTVGMTSCDDDDNADVPPITDLTGVFYGVNTTSVMGSQDADSTSVSRLINEGNGKFTVVLPESTEPASDPMAMPTIQLKGVQFVADGKDNYTAVIDSTVVQVNDKKATIKKFKGIVNPVSKKFTVSFSLQYGRMPLFIDNSFSTLTKEDFVCGKFVGVSSMKVHGQDAGSDSTSVATIAIQENGKFAVSLPAAAKEGRGMDLPSITLSDIELAGDANVFTFANDSLGVQAGGMNIIIKDLKGTVKNNVMSLSYTFKPGAMPMYINTTYTGNKQNK